MLLFAFNCCNQPHSFNVACIISQLALLLLCLKLMSLHVYSYIHIQWQTNEIQRWSSTRMMLTQTTQFSSTWRKSQVTFKESRYWTDESYDWELTQNNELNIINMKSNAEKATLRPLIKVLYDEFDDLFLNVESFFIRAVMKFVIQQNCWTYVALQTVTKVLKRLRTHNPLCVKEAITKNCPQHQHSTWYQWRSISRTSVYRCASKHNCWDSLMTFSVKCCYNQRCFVRSSLNNNNFITQMLFKLWVNILSECQLYWISHNQIHIHWQSSAH
jgi:hypothetical protein